MPAKMLSLNPGLKEITHSITGGALAAQGNNIFMLNHTSYWDNIGYWMPYSAAREVCTTFCYHIAGALIPIFGPSFPSHCVSPEAPEHGRMTIDPAIVRQATAEAEAYRIHHSMLSPRDCYSPQQRSLEPLNTHPTPPPNNLDHRMRLKRAFEGDSPCGTSTDTDVDGSASESSNSDFYYYSPITPVSANSLHIPHPWQSPNAFSASANAAVNSQQQIKLSHGPNPLLSAIPRSTGMGDAQISQQWTSIKRRIEEVDADDEMESEDTGSSVSDRGDKAIVPNNVMSDASDSGGTEQKAAWLLMKLNVKDGEYRNEIAKELGSPQDQSRIKSLKRRRATSMWALFIETNGLAF
jgi:hypothetical protein